MKRKQYLFDTHALLFWFNKIEASSQFINFFDEQNRQGTLHVSSISFWEIALLARKQKIAISDVHGWKNEIFTYTNLNLLDVSAADMIDSTLLPAHHKDPFDRLLIAQAKRNDMTLVTRDSEIQNYDVLQLWL